MTIGVVVLTGVVLLGSAAVLGAEPAPQAGPEQHEHTPLLLRGADQLFSSTGDEGSWKSPGGGDGDTGQKPFDWAAERRACEGCPPRSVGRALFQTTIINVFYEAANLIRGQVTAKITPKTWWDNMEHGWVWDLDDFAVNQVGHPYQGNNYFTSGRANGLSFYESAALTAFGSGTWEYFGETNQASLNDFINTTLGGIALGEMFHRAAWLVRDTRATGRGRLWREIGATAIDPVTGYNRFRTGDASRVSDKPADMVPSRSRGSGRRACSGEARRHVRSTRLASRSWRWICCMGISEREQPDAV